MMNPGLIGTWPGGRWTGRFMPALPVGPSWLPAPPMQSAFMPVSGFSQTPFFPQNDMFALMGQMSSLLLSVMSLIQQMRPQNTAQNTPNPFAGSLSAAQPQILTAGNDPTLSAQPPLPAQSSVVQGVPQAQPVASTAVSQPPLPETTQAQAQPQSDVAQPAPAAPKPAPAKPKAPAKKAAAPKKANAPVKTGQGSSTPKMEKLAQEAKKVALSMGGYKGLGRCATGVTKAIQKAMGITVRGNGKDFARTLPKSGKFEKVNIPLSEALKHPGYVICWQVGSSSLGKKYGHVAVTLGDGKATASDFVERDTRPDKGRSGVTIWKPIA